MTTTPSVSATNQSPLDLLTRLQAWDLDSPGATLTFAGKLTRDNGWSERHSARVIGEYLRFVVLAVTADHPVCPSDAVDRAWHQHLLDTHAYWDRFCPDLLGRPLHHRPSSGRPGERQQLVEWYRRTLESYRLTFGQAPPIDIWPPEDERFRRPVRFRLPRRWLAGLSWPMVVLLVVGLGGCQVVRFGLNSGAAQIWSF